MGGRWFYRAKSRSTTQRRAAIGTLLHQTIYVRFRVPSHINLPANQSCVAGLRVIGSDGHNVSRMRRTLIKPTLSVTAAWASCFCHERLEKRHREPPIPLKAAGPLIDRPVLRSLRRRDDWKTTPIGQFRRRSPPPAGMGARKCQKIRHALGAGGKGCC